VQLLHIACAIHVAQPRTSKGVVLGTLLIVRDAFYGVRRFSDFLAHLKIPKAVSDHRPPRLAPASPRRPGVYREPTPRLLRAILATPILVSCSQYAAFS
jgi:hypothetical protein